MYRDQHWLTVEYYAKGVVLYNMEDWSRTHCTYGIVYNVYVEKMYIKSVICCICTSKLSSMSDETILKTEEGNILNLDFFKKLFTTLHNFSINKQLPLRG